MLMSSSILSMLISLRNHSIFVGAIVERQWHGIQCLAAFIMNIVRDFKYLLLGIKLWCSRYCAGSSLRSSEVIAVIVSSTIFQKDWISGHDHHMWSIEPSPSPHLQHLLEIWDENLWSKVGVLYHLVTILKPHSWVATFRDPLWVCIKMVSHSARDKLRLRSFSQARHDALEKSATVSNSELYSIEIVCL